MAIELVSGSAGMMQELLKGEAPQLVAGKPTCFVCLFGYGGIEHFTVEALLREMRLFDAQSVNFALHIVHGDALISRSRSKALSVFMDVPYFDTCLMVDHDIQWQPGALLGLAQKAFEHKSIVAGLYANRGFNRGMSSRLKGESARWKPEEDKLLEAEYLATGFMAIPRVVGEEVLKDGERESQTWKEDQDPNLLVTKCIYTDGSAFHDFFRPIVVPSAIPNENAKHEYLSEDWSFCWRARLANPNRPLYAWTFPWLVHHGTFGFTLDTAFTRRDK